MKSFREFLLETPLPDSFDSKKFKLSYNETIDYIEQKKKIKLGKGSSRVTFQLSPADFIYCTKDGIFKKENSVLKVAYNEKGIAQNKAEIKVLIDKKFKDILIPLIDYDESTEPRWIHLAKADKVTEEKICSIINCPNLKTFIGYTIEKADNKLYSSKAVMFMNQIKKFINNDENKLDIFNSYVDELILLEKAFKLVLYDLENFENWGLYKGNLVIIDVGLDEDSSKHYPSKKGFGIG